LRGPLRRQPKFWSAALPASAESEVQFPIVKRRPARGPATFLMTLVRKRERNLLPMSDTMSTTAADFLRQTKKASWAPSTPTGSNVSPQDRRGRTSATCPSRTRSTRPSSAFEDRGRCSPAKVGEGRQGRGAPGHRLQVRGRDPGHVSSPSGHDLDSSRTFVLGRDENRNARAPEGGQKKVA